MAPSNTYDGSFYYQICGDDGKPIATIGDKGIECATFGLDTFYDRYDYCVVKDTGKCYSGYRAFIKEHCYHRLSDWKNGELPIKDRVYKIVDCAPHENDKDTMIYVIEDMDTEQIYLIRDDGIVKVTEPIKYTWGLSNITTNDCATIVCDTYTNEKFPTIKKGEMEMKNEVLELYAKREKEKIAKRFKAMKEEEYNNLEAVKKYNELIGNFKASLAELVDEYKGEEPKIFVQTVYEDHFGYEINPYLETEISEKYREDYEANIKELNDKIEEIRAVLSMSTDVEYQRGILVEYGILNKKGVMVNE